ncbi:hypothetical protein R1CP_40345 (plasmid) [Rhodococcus opacus]|uniref:Abortive infection bacteriophage resistance protein n=1 Tax=Rhodococcus opacus TaxID=37919 RepID=A0A1B1KJ57_RHOOP|nr:hypothetical protein R1CP_40345 [Rhodococcus opacus]
MKRVLYDAGYYRFSGYLRYFQKNPSNGNNDFRPGVKFDDVKRVYLFDDELRRWLFDGICILEVVFRARFAYEMATRMGDPVDYLEAATYRPGESVDNARGDLLRRIEDDIRQSKEPYIHKFTSAGSRVPVWAATEVLSFGTVSKMFELIADFEIVKAVSKSMKLPATKTAGTLQSLSVLRNICAHHGRVWNRAPKVAIPVKNHLMTDPDKSIYHRTPWAWIVVLSELVDSIKGNSDFSTEFFQFLAEYQDLYGGLKQPRLR